jgi:hypothetical protein
MCVWNGLLVFISVLFLTGGIFKATLIAIFVLVSCLLGFGQRWLLRGGFVVAVLAILVWIGAIPHPDQWKDIFRDVRASLGTNMVTPTVAAPDAAPFRPLASSERSTDRDESRRQ